MTTAIESNGHKYEIEFIADVGYCIAERQEDGRWVYVHTANTEQAARNWILSGECPISVDRYGIPADSRICKLFEL